jgi:hypothetical protein
MAIVMTETRKRIEVDASIMEIIGPMMFFAKASDGVWIPMCDLAQYEAGNRHFLN